jgi:hypothetical protein
MSHELIDQAIEQIKNGNKQRGQQLLAQALIKDSKNVRAWLWLSVCLEETERKRYCLQKALEVDPALEAAQQALAELPLAAEIKVTSGAPVETEAIPTEPAPAFPILGEAPTGQQPAVASTQASPAAQKTVPVKRPQKTLAVETPFTLPAALSPDQQKTAPTQRRRQAGLQGPPWESGKWKVEPEPKLEPWITVVVFLLVILVGVLLATVLTYLYLF